MDIYTVIDKHYSYSEESDTTTHMFSNNHHFDEKAAKIVLISKCRERFNLSLQEAQARINSLLKECGYPQ